MAPEADGRFAESGTPRRSARKSVEQDLVNVLRLERYKAKRRLRRLGEAASTVERAAEESAVRSALNSAR
jgi:hypothetical protein